MKKDNIEKPTKEQIEAWKAQYGEVICIEVEEASSPIFSDPDTDFEEAPKLTCYLRKPDKLVMNLALSMISRDAVAAGKAVVKNCWLGGNLEIQNDSSLLACAGAEAVHLVETHRSRLKKV